MPFTGHSLELMSSAVLRIPALTRSPGRARCWTRARRSARPVRSRVLRCARRCRRCHASDFALAGVQPGAHLDAEGLHRIADRHGAADSSLRTVEHREKAISDVFTSRPRNRTSCDRTTASCASSSACQSRSPISAARRVESTMSVNSTVANTRSSATSAWWPVRNAAISWKDARHGFDQVVDVATRHSTYSRPVCGLRPTFLRGRDERIVGVLEDKGWHADCRKHRPHVHLRRQR